MKDCCKEEFRKLVRMCEVALADGELPLAQKGRVTYATGLLTSYIGDKE